MKNGILITSSLALLAATLLSVELGEAKDSPKAIRALLVIGGCCHDYAKQKEILTKGISARAHVDWVVSYDPDKGTKHLNPVYEKTDWSQGFDVIVHDECCSDVNDEAVVNRILEPHRQGLPAVILHCGIHSYRTKGYPNATPWFEFTGLPSTGHGPQQPIAISFVDKESPITKGLAAWTTVNEELYNNSAGKLLDTARPLARGKQGASDFVVAWTNTYLSKTKVFATTLGHNNDTVADGRYLDLVTRGLLWSVDKLNDSYLKPAVSASSSDSAPEWLKIFDGKTLKGWEGSAHWVVKDDAISGVITNDTLIKTNTFLIWKGGTVANFELKCKFRMEGGNSGIQYRSTHLDKDKADPFIVKGYQADMAVSTYTGILYEERGRGIIAQVGEKVVMDETGKKKVVGSLGEKILDGFDITKWHDYHIIAKGNHLQQFIDGKQTIDLIDHDKKGRALEGILALQIHVGGPMLVQFKDMVLKRMPAGGIIEP